MTKHSRWSSRRKYRFFDGSLITTAERHSSQLSPLNQYLLDSTRTFAESSLAKVTISEILNWPNLRRYLLFSGFLSLVTITFGFGRPDVAALAARRMIWLDDTTWPRTCRIELVGISVERDDPVEGILESGRIVKPVDGKLTVARGSSFSVRIRAEMPSAANPSRELPDSCRFLYWTADGLQGSTTMNRIGSPHDGFQDYSLRGPPVEGILSNMEFEVRGGDHRTKRIQIVVVDAPTVVSAEVACVFPGYMVDSDSMRWTPRDIPWVGPMSLPRGTLIQFRVRTNNPIKKVYTLSGADRVPNEFDVYGQEFELPVGYLNDGVSAEVYLCDRDNLVSERPFVIAMEPIDDQPPIVQTRLIGIGTAVTPNVQIPIKSQIEDDYGIKRSWLEIELPLGENLTIPLADNPTGDVEATIDFLQLQRNDGQNYKLPTDAGTTISLVAKAADRFDLTEEPNVGVGDQYVLDVVDENRFLRLLERMEVAQRRRLEQIYREVADSRSFLERTSANFVSPSMIVEPGDNALPDGLKENSSHDENEMELRLLYAQRTLNQIDKSIQETLGVANAFENIRLQLINNRIDSEDRKLPHRKPRRGTTHRCRRKLDGSPKTGRA